MLPHFAQILADFLVSRAGVITICVLIVAVFLFLCYRFLRDLNPLSEELNKALNLVTAQPSMSDFSTCLQDFSNEIESYKTLGPFWREFYETLIFPQSQDKDQSIRNTKEVASCFNESTILAPNIDLPYYAAVPNYLTGFGILGTFMGLVAGIYRASQGLASSDAEELRHALEGLLGGASMAFWTSIVGLATSILFSWFEKRQLHGVRRLITRWNDELERRIKRITHEDLAGLQLQELRKQSDFLEEFTTHIAYNIAGALGDKMNDRLVPALEQLTHAVEEMRDHRNQTNTEMLVEIVREFKNTLTANAGEEMQALSHSLEKMNNSLRPLLQEMADVHKQFKDASQAISTHIMESYKSGSEEFAKCVVDTMNHVRTATGELGELLSNQLRLTFEQGRREFEALMGLFAERLHDLEKAGQTFRTVLNDAEITLKGLKEAVEHVNDLSQKFASVSEHLSDVSTRMQRIAQETGHTHASLQSLAAKVNDGLNQFYQVQETIKNQWHSYLSRFENVDAALNRVFIILTNGLESFAANTKDYVKALDEHTGQITTSFGGAVKELQEAIEELNEALNSRRQPS
ncbi:MAG: anti-phage ZorAB system protein ZorA [Desulfosoma sp.]|uniref:anti-phage ZorAB system protein ZorA n=1 Tax=Desulfosoma sp. TaxID=2603217 RepID=UPI00404A8FBB